MPEEKADHTMESLKLKDLHLNVRQPQKLRRFYESLGFRSKDLGDAIVLSAGDQPILYLHETAKPRRHETGLYHFAILLPTRGALANLLHHIIESQIPVDGASHHHVSEAIYLRDPEGNGIELYADTPASTWWEGNRLIMDTNRLDIEDLLGARTADGPYPGLPQGTTLGHLHLHVQDLDKSRTFYREHLGLSETMSYTQAWFLARDGYHHHIAVNTWLPGKPCPKEEGSPGLARYTVLLEDTLFHTLFPQVTEDRITLTDPDNLRVTLQKANRSVPTS